MSWSSSKPASTSSVKIELLGTSFTIKSDEEEEHLARVLAYLQEKLAQASSSVRTQDPLKIAILAGLLLADENIKGSDAKAQFEENDEVEAIAQRLIAQIDEII